MTGTLLYDMDSRERHSKLTEEMHIPMPKEDRNWHTRVLDKGKVTQLNLPLQ